MSERNKFLVFMRGLFPLKQQLKIEYRIKCKNKLNLKNPKRLTEKYQAYKYEYRDDLMVYCADKSTAPIYVKEKGLDHIIIKNIGIFDNVDDINFETLPNSFIIKSNTGSGNNIVVKNSKEINNVEITKKMKKWLKWRKRQFGTEWVYKKIKPKIIIEELLPYDENDDLPDFKFFCFNGKVEFMYTMIDYTADQSKGKLNFYDKHFNKLPFGRADFPQFQETKMKKPENFDKMVEYAEILSKDFPHVRVDFYNINGKIYFGELTFFTLGGYMKFNPDKYDFLLGELFELNWRKLNDE